MHRFLPLAILILAGCFDSNRWEMVRSEDFASPDGELTATIFEMSAFNTTGDYPQLSVRRPGEKLRKLGNILQGGLNDSLTARWTSPTNLLVEYVPDHGSPLQPESTNVAGVLATVRLRAGHQLVRQRRSSLRE